MSPKHGERLRLAVKENCVGCRLLRRTSMGEKCAPHIYLDPEKGCVPHLYSDLEGELGRPSPFLPTGGWRALRVQVCVRT